MSDQQTFNIDFNVPFHLVYHYYISGTVAFFLNTFVIYLIIFHSSRLDSFKFYLLAFQISCLICDLNTAFLMQPIGLFPICAGYSYGILSRVFSWSSHLLMTIFTFLISEQVNILAICFLRKHKAIMSLEDITSSANYIYHVWYSFCLLFPFAIAFSIYRSGDTLHEQMRILEELYPEYAGQFGNLREFQYYPMNNKLILFFALVTFGTTKSTVLITCLVYRMYTALTRIQSRLSTYDLVKHKVVLKSLIVQFLTTPISFIPVFVIMMTVIVPTYHSQEISWVACMVSTTHSIFNSIVVILTYPEFRRVVVFWKTWKKKTKTSQRILINCFKI
ncbi:Serpentine Receptor, class H [Caenorhabditis elegans]|uniref:Serpentine Receptor, class H n=1 Tax=Caenorhabditis elegans TaxID=6239 RepID=O44574_CAEEL|nr:Serpentine Receptor, class H [Caenorhabditis elegans]CCD74365.1 Serpentine Receptor, class H [Caenorhabditis elegans]|eukprot:NP_503490.1 Serpentine Receptor, class I [Caenorhabditis elegans]